MLLNVFQSRAMAIPKKGESGRVCCEGKVPDGLTLPSQSFRKSYDLLEGPLAAGGGFVADLVVSKAYLQIVSVRAHFAHTKH